jgi:protein-disulfide isomerase
MTTGYTNKLVVGMLLISIATNIVLATRLHFPQFFQQLRLALVAPPKLGPSDHTRGPAATGAVLIVYTNYQCPFCAELNRNLQALTNELDFQVAYRHLADPISQPFAYKAAMGAECASEQNRFWEYNDRLFQPDQALDGEVLPGIARQLQLNMDQFQECLAVEKYAGKIVADTQSAEAKKVIATPTFFINGKRHEGSRPLAEMKQLLIAAINKIE